MLIRPQKGKRRPLFSSFYSLALGFSVLAVACDKAPSKRGPEESAPKAPVDDSQGAHDVPGEPPGVPDEAHHAPNEPHHEGSAASAPESQTEAAPAVESAASAPQFAEGTTPEFRAAFASFQKWVSARKGTVHAALVDLENDKWLLRAGADAPVNPASNAKVLTAAAALELLGPAYTFETQLFGSISSTGVCKRLVLKGGGAPDLTTADLSRLIRVAKGQGLTEVQEIVVDQSRFDESFTPPAFEQQPDEWAPFRAPISALAVNENSITLNVVPTAQGEAARVWYDPPGIVMPEGSIATTEKGGGDRVSWKLDSKKDAARPLSVVGGTAGEGMGRLRYARRMEDPRLAGGYALAALLEESGIVAGKSVKLGSLASEPRIALWSSEPVAEIVRALGKDSNNFVAEMLLVALSQAGGAEKGDAKKKNQPWSSKRGAQKVVDWLKDKKINVDGLVVKNGSGLFDANRMSAALLVSVLASLEDNPRVYQDFVSHLAMGATDGTMKQRMRGSELGQRIRAKTGTLKNVDALTGYIQRPGGKSPAAFSVIVVGPLGSHGEVRNRVDALILKWAKIL